VSNNVYFTFIRRWAWLIALFVIVAIIATHAALDRRIPLYQSTATIQVGRTIEDSQPDQVSLAISDRLVPSYAELAKRDPVLDAAAEELGLPLSAADLRARLLVSIVPQAQLIDLKVVDADPNVAAAIANEIARQVVLQSPDTAAQSDETQAFLQDQLANLQAKITQGQSDIADLEASIEEMTTALDVSNAQQQLEVLQSQVDAWQSSYVTLLTAAEPSETNIVRLLSQASPASAPIASPTKMYYAFAMIVGGGAAAALALVLSMLFSSVQRSEDLRRLGTSLPVVTVPFERGIKLHPLISSSAPSSSIAASYRVLRNVLQTEQSDATPVTIAVMSSRPGEGKTTTVANLAIALANIGRGVILVDANVRNPSIDQMFGTDTTRGLSDVILGDCLLDDVLQSTAYPNLTVLGAGSIPGNYTDILSAGRVRMVLQAVTALAEITLIDAPGIQEEQEALLLAKEADAAIVVVEAGRTRLTEVERTLELLQRSGVSVVSIALNKAGTQRVRLDRLPWSREARMQRMAAARRLDRVHLRPLPIAGASDDAGEPTPLKGRPLDAHTAAHPGRPESA
jgi:non-specific protein-tyrosine kinase